MDSMRLRGSKCESVEVDVDIRQIYNKAVIGKTFTVVQSVNIAINTWLRAVGVYASTDTVVDMIEVDGQPMLTWCNNRDDEPATLVLSLYEAEIYRNFEQLKKQIIMSELKGERQWQTK